MCLKLVSMGGASPLGRVLCFRIRPLSGSSSTIWFDQEKAILPLASLGGVFAEPAGATAYAGVQRAVELGMVGSDEIVVVINTGSGLKDIKAATQITAGMRVIPPVLAAVKEAPDPALTAL